MSDEELREEVQGGGSIPTKQLRNLLSRSCINVWYPPNDGSFHFNKKFAMEDTDALLSDENEFGRKIVDLLSTYSYAELALDPSWQVRRLAKVGQYAKASEGKL